MPRTAVSAVYSPVMKTVHWTTVVLVIALLLIGWTMTSGFVMSRTALDALLGWHKSLGILVLFLTLFRIAWRGTHRPPALPPGLRPWEIVAVEVVHKLLYVLLVLQPVTGWCLSTLSPVKTRFFGSFFIPNLPFLSGFRYSPVAREALEGAHGFMAGLLAVLLVVHAGAAFKHHFMVRDDVLLRMAPASLGPALKKLRGER